MSKDNFQWTDELVKEFFDFQSKHERFPINYLIMEFKASHQPKQQPKESEFKTEDDVESYYNEELKKMNSWFLGEMKKILNQRFEPKQQSKDWEIIEFRVNFWGSENVAFTLGRHGLYETGLNGEIFKRSSRELIDNGAKIETVKRLSDNEVFSVGDEVSYLPISQYGSFIIDHFRIPMDNKNKILACSKADGIVECVDDSLGKKSPEQKSKPIEKERITLETALEFKNGDYSDSYFIRVPKPIEKQKWPLIKQAIEQALNDENEDYIVRGGVKWSPSKGYEDAGRPYFTNAEAIHQLNKDNYHVIHDIQFQSDKAKHEKDLEDAFNAGRGRYVNQKNGETYYDYPTFPDYLTAKQSQQP